MNHVPLTLIALEVGATADALAARFGDAVTIDGIGLRSVSADAARQFLTDHRASLQKARDLEAARREEAQRQPHPTRDRVRGLMAKQRPISGTDGPAYSRLMADEHAAREQVYPQGGPLTYHAINSQKS
jgi:hypothetical protein